MVLVCPWSAGGGTDRVSRHIAALMEMELGVPVNVVNATGGAGVTGHTRGALAKPDGYTLAMITPELNMLHWRDLTNITYRDFEPLMLVNRDEAALFVQADSDWKSLAELTLAVRKNPGQLQASRSSRLGIWHLSLAGWLAAEKLNADTVKWIGNNGSKPSLQELVAGGVDMVCCSVPEALSLLEAGKVRCLGVMADERLPGMSSIPTFKDQEVNWIHRGWRGLALPKGVPQDRFNILLKAATKVITSKDYLDYMKNNNFGAAAVPPKEFASFLKDDDAFYGRMLNSREFTAVKSQRLGPYFFPIVLGVAFVFVILISVFKKRTPTTTPEIMFDRKSLRYVAAVVIWIVLFVVALDWAGFVLAGIVFLTLLFLIMQVRLDLALILPLLLVPSLWQLFAVTLRVPLPWGWFGW